MDKEIKPCCWVADQKFLNLIVSQKYCFDESLKYLEDKVDKIISRDSNFSSAKLVEQIMRLFKRSRNQDPFDTGIFGTETVSYGKENYSAYLAYYLFANVYKIWQPLTDLAVNGLIKNNIDVLDVGCGPGSEAIGIVEFFKRQAILHHEQMMQINLYLCDRERQFLEYAEELLRAIVLPSNLNVRFIKITSDVYSLPIEQGRKFDIVTFSNVLCRNENDGKNLENIDVLLNRIVNLLSDDGSLIVINPGDRSGAEDLALVDHRLSSKYSVFGYSSCNSFCRTNICTNNCWRIARVYLEAPDIWVRLWKDGLTKGKKESVPFCYDVFRKDGKRKYSDFVRNEHYLSLAEASHHVGKRISIAAVVVGIIDNGAGMNDVTLKLGDRTCSNTKGEFIVKFNRSVLCGKSYNMNFMANEMIYLDDFLIEKKRDDYILTTDKDKITFKLMY